jgi:hypothetical protein
MREKTVSVSSLESKEDIVMADKNAMFCLK